MLDKLLSEKSTTNTEAITIICVAGDRFYVSLYSLLLVYATVRCHLYIRNCP